MNWLSDFYRKHPEYRGLPYRKTANSIHFEIAPNVYQAHIWIDRRFERTASGLLIPFSRLTESLRVMGRLLREPRQAAAFAAMLPFGTVFTDGPGGTVTTSKDNYIQGTVGGTTNYGTSNILAMGWFDANNQYRTLLEFTLTSIPTSAVVTQSQLTLTFSGTAGGGTKAYTYTAYRVVRTWVETEATWNIAATGTNWGTAGCNNTTSDRLATGESAQSLAPTADSTWSIPTMTQVWVTTPANNKGVIILPGAWVVAEKGINMPASSDHATAAIRPLLTVTYTLPAGGAPIQQPFASAFRGPFG